MTEPTPVPLACPNCFGTTLTATWQVFVSMSIVAGQPVELMAEPADASDFFVSLECGTCGFGLSGGGSGRTHHGDLSNGQTTVNDDALFDKFVQVADAATEVIESQSIRQSIAG